MIRKYPGRTLAAVAALAVVLFALGGPGKNDKSGPWMYISGLSFIGFLLTTVVFLVLAVFVLATRKRNRAQS